MKRRDFLRLAGFFPFAYSGPIINKNFSSFPGEEGFFSPTTGELASNVTVVPEAPFFYDGQAFEAAERVVFLNSWRAVVNIIPKQGLSLDIRFTLSEADIFLSRPKSFFYSGVKDSLDIPVESYFWGPELRYRIEYRDSLSKGSWKALPWRQVKTPLSFLQSGNLKIILWGDDHTFDDADMGTRVVKDSSWRQARLSGDYVNILTQQLLANPEFVPEYPSEWAKTMSGLCLASALRQIMVVEKPDLVLILGDTTGIGAGYKWRGLGLKDPAEGLTAAELDAYSRLFWLRMRKMLSAITPTIPVYIVLGNHDGESSYDAARQPARFYRQKYFRQPGQETGNAINQNYYSLPWGEDGMGRVGVQLIVLDNESYNPPWMPLIPEQWTLGEGQKQWLNNVLGQDSDLKFAFFHHVLGGWPRGTNEAITDYAYGRGPLFTFEDYLPYCANPEAVEQVTLTQWLLQAGVKALFYGHDHVFHPRNIKDNQNRKMLGVCVGSTKHVGELLWYEGEIWKKFYGSYGRYWANQENGDPLKASFWGPSGYTRLTIDKSGCRVDFVRAAYNHPYTNIPPEKKVGQVITSVVL